MERKGGQNKDVFITGISADDDKRIQRYSSCHNKVQVWTKKSTSRTKKSASPDKKSTSLDIKILLKFNKTKLFL